MDEYLYNVHMYTIAATPVAKYCVCTQHNGYAVATISRLLKIIGLVCRMSSILQGSFAKEACNFTEPTNRSHPIMLLHVACSGHEEMNLCRDYYLCTVYVLTSIC